MQIRSLCMVIFVGKKVCTCVSIICAPPFALPLRINQVDKFGKPTWRRLVMTVEGAAGGDNPALAQTIAIEHPGKTGSKSDTRLCRKTS